MIEIDLEGYLPKLKFKRERGRPCVFDPVRRKYLVAEKEEVVRQLLILYFTEGKKYPKGKLSVEKLVLVNGTRRRFDLLVYDHQTKPFLLVECKNPEVEINDKVFRQIAAYNLPLKVPFLMVTNGRSNWCCEMDYRSRGYRFLTEVPDYPAI